MQVRPLHDFRASRVPQTREFGKDKRLAVGGASTEASPWGLTAVRMLLRCFVTGPIYMRAVGPPWGPAAVAFRGASKEGRERELLEYLP
jgi:hypothetical protein